MGMCDFIFLRCIWKSEKNTWFRTGHLCQWCWICNKFLQHL